MVYTTRRGAQTGAVLWCVESEGSPQHVVPDGAMDLMWFQGRLVVAGPDTQTMVFEQAPDEMTWGLRLAPGVAHALLGVSAQELTNRRVELSDLTGPNVGVRASFEKDVPGGLERLLVELWRRAEPERPLLWLASSLDGAARRELSVQRTAAEHGMSERTLRRLSGRLFGYGFKTLVQIHRFQRAMHLAQAGMTLSEVAATAGYADQAHLARACKKLAGKTPSELAAAV